MSGVLKLKPTFQYQHNSCALCGLASDEGTQFMFCSKCRTVVYCSKEHQVAHWKRHKKICRDHIWKKDSSLGSTAAASCTNTRCACKTWHLESSELTSVQTLPQSTSSQQYPNHVASFAGGKANATSVGEPSRSSNELMLSSEDALKSHFAQIASYNKNSSISSTKSSSHLPPQEDLEFQTLDLGGISGFTVTAEQSNQSSAFLAGGNNTGTSVGPIAFASSDSTSHPVTGTTEPQQDNLLQKDRQEGITKSNYEDKEGSPDGSVVKELTMSNSSTSIPFQHRNNMAPLSSQTTQKSRVSMLTMWKQPKMGLSLFQQVIDDLNRYGVCVVDNLLGDTRGGLVLREVQSMYSSGAFQDGQLVKGQDVMSKAIRGDKITWVDGREPNCKNIAVLVKILDNIVMGANNLEKIGQMGRYTIRERTKAMVACYPGSGTHYVKHVDNPNDDGRCITAIYYLNQDWNTKINGGLLRIFPEGWSHQVADIEPLFDRVIFFWSDRRNPHEVQPAYKTRYAITLWYYDSNAKARTKLSSESNKSSDQKSPS